MTGLTTKVFKELLSSYLSKQFNVFVLEGGSRSSKTHSVIQFWIWWANENRGKPRRVIVSRLKGTWLTATVYKDFMDALKVYGIYERERENKSNRVYTLFDTQFWFLGLDDPQKIHGMKSDAFWINEAIEASWEDYAQLMQRCEGFGVLDYNPAIDEHWIYDKVCKRPRTFFSHSTMLDNPLISKNAKEHILSYEPTEENYKNGTADKNKWEVYGLGLRSKLEGVIFDNWDIVKEIPSEAKIKHHRYGLDFGYTNDPTCLSDVYWRGNEIWADELIYETNLTNPQIGKRIIQYGLKTVKGYADSAEPKSIEEIHQMAINIHCAKKGPDSIKNGIDILKRYKIHITERSLNGIKEFRNYKWMQDKNGKWLNEPIDDFNHFIDPLRYVALSELAEKAKQQDLTKFFP